MGRNSEVLSLEWLPAEAACSLMRFRLEQQGRLLGDHHRIAAEEDGCLHIAAAEGRLERDRQGRVLVDPSETKC